jgi:integrase
MNLKYADYGYTLKNLGSVITADFLFNPDIPVSRKSSFGDSVWDWSDEHNARLKVVNDSKVRFDWDEITIGKEACENAVLRSNQKFSAMLPEEMVEDIRRAIFIYTMFPSLVATRGKPAKEGKKAITVVYRINCAVNFFSYLYLQNLFSNGVARIRKLSDITTKDLQKAVNAYPYRSDEVKKTLTLFCNEYVQSNLKYGRLKWNHFDLKNIVWRAEKERESIETLPDMLFRLLSNKSCDLVGSFLYLMGIELSDSQAAMAVRDTWKQKWPDFPEMFESYVERRLLTRNGDRNGIRNHTYHFKRRFGVIPKDFMKFLFDVQCAAQVMLLLYTAMRYSEAASILTGCLIRRDEVHLVKSTLIKGRRTNLPLDDDEWVAIDIVQDAVRALEELSRCTFNNFLFSNFDTVKVGEEENPLSNTGLSQRMNEYLGRIDVEDTWSEWELSTHQFRHGLVYQLANAEVGIPYITRQLHHYHSRLVEGSYKINQTSTIYGMQRERIVGNITGLNAIRAAKSQVVHALYGEGRKFAGGGAAIHVERTEGFFKGAGLYGQSRERYINRFIEFGGTTVRTGVGWCTRNHVDPDKLKEDVPPCIGDLNCNPFTCKHSVVPESRLPDILDRYRNAIKKLNSPDQAFLRKHWEKERDSLASMLMQLGQDPERVLEGEAHAEGSEKLSV